MDKTAYYVWKPIHTEQMLITVRTVLILFVAILYKECCLLNGLLCFKINPHQTISDKSMHSFDICFWFLHTYGRKVVADQRMFKCLYCIKVLNNLLNNKNKKLVRDSFAKGSKKFKLEDNVYIYGF